MRIIGGFLKGMVIRSADSFKHRPSTGVFKEGLFSILESMEFLSEARVLDLCAGTGAIGFEAISRGASFAMMIDNDTRHISAIESSAKELGVRDSVGLICCDIRSFSDRIRGTDLYDLVFIDLPYDMVSGVLYSVIDVLKKKSEVEGSFLKSDAIIVVELPFGKDSREFVTRYSDMIIKERRYGNSVLVIMICAQPMDH